MREKFSRSWYLIKMSYRVLQEDRELIVYPIIASIAVVLIIGIYSMPMIMSGALYKSNKYTIYLLTFISYLVLYVVVIFSNAALVGSVTIRLQGKNPTVMDGFKIAMDHLGNILGYALIGSTVGLILGIIQDKLGSFGKLLTFITNMAWNIMTFLVIPVLVIEDIGPVNAIKRSASLLKKTWGEQIIGNTGIGFFFGFVMFGMALLFVPVIAYLSGQGMISLAIIAGTILGIAFFLSIVISSTLDTIFRVILYKYAVDGTVHGHIEEVHLKNAFQTKNKDKR